jgi:triphosphoribosyl-dephospho-CoA synthase
MSAAAQFAIPTAHSAQRSERGLIMELIADQAVLALLRELAAWPKPGLVSHVDSGSHTDMDAAVLQASAMALRPFFVELARAGQDGSDMGRLRTIGLRAETAMLAVTGGVNTHRGAIFGLGLLCAAAGAIAQISIEGAAVASMRLGEVVRRRWRRRSGEVRSRSSAMALARCGATARAAPGLRRPVDFATSTRRVGRPCGRAAACGPTTLTLQACFALIASVCDTNLLHRGGADGMRYATETAATFLSQGGVGAPDWRARAATVHAVFVARRLSPGGCADLLAMTLFVDALESRVALP